MGMTMDDVGRLIAEGPGSHEMLGRIIGEFGADPIPYDIISAGKAYGWGDERILGALALFMCWQQRETKRLLEKASDCASQRPSLPATDWGALAKMGYDPRDPLYFIDHPLG